MKPIANSHKYSRYDTDIPQEKKVLKDIEVGFFSYFKLEVLIL